MKKTLGYAVFSMLAIMITASLASAAEAVAAVALSGADKASVTVWSIIGAALAMGLGTIGTGLGMGNGLNGASNAVGRNPEAQGKILTTMMVGLAMIESLAIYALVVALIILYANPLLGKILGI